MANAPTVRAVNPAASSSQERLARARRAATLLDSAITLPGGIRIGLDPLLGLVPVVGDWLGELLGLYVCYQAYRADVATPTLVRMVLTLVADALVGSLPVVGDALDVAFRANERNVARFERAVAAEFTPE
ncbi:MAG: DUF4112 domain-containing protein [Halolamina sp.]